MPEEKINFDQFSEEYAPFRRLNDLRENLCESLGLDLRQSSLNSNKENPNIGRLVFDFDSTRGYLFENVFEETVSGFYKARGFEIVKGKRNGIMGHKVYASNMQNRPEEKIGEVSNLIAKRGEEQYKIRISKANGITYVDIN